MRQQKLFTVLGILALATLLLIYPESMTQSARISGKYALEMIWIFPAILVLMGLADVWVPKEAIDKYLGEQSGVRGILISIFLGTLPTGPVYMAFPIAAELLRKKASTTNIMIFLGVWASLKIPQIGMEIQFLGLKFATLRFILTLISILITSFLIGYIEKKFSQKDNTNESQNLKES